MSACCEVLKHLWALVAHHSHKPKVSGEQMAALTYHPSERVNVRRVKAEPQTKPPVRREHGL